MTFEQWMQQQGLSAATVNKYSTAIAGVISTWTNSVNSGFSSLHEVQSLNELTVLIEQIKQLEIFKQRDEIGKGMYSAALKKFALYFQADRQRSLIDDVTSIAAELLGTDKTRMLACRLGQGVFRRQLLDYWGGCAISRYAGQELLVASHIKPWRHSSAEERLSVYNGLLLLPNYDRAFDQGLISFFDDGKIMISGELKSAEALALHPKLSIRTEAPHSTYLSYHRQYVFRN